MFIEEKDVVILGGGICGLAAASVLGDRAVVLEMEARPGGLVRTDCFNGYWFDHVLHILYFRDADTEKKIKRMLGNELAWCPPEAWVETAGQVVRYPFQMHLGGLGTETAIRCLHDLAQVTFGNGHAQPANFKEMLSDTFGKAMCDEFLFPYNEKLWKRPLTSLAPTGFQWTITHPDFQQVLKGALTDNPELKPYNSNGWYPRPAPDSPVRGMEVLSRALAGQVSDLRLAHTVTEIDLDNSLVVVRNVENQQSVIRFKHCCSTIPLPRVIEMCHPVPADLRQSMHELTCNSVVNVCLCVKGERPANTGHWRYFSDPDLVFTRLVYMHEFDPLSAPSDGWGLMAELTGRAEDGIPSAADIILKVKADLLKAGVITDESQIRHAWLIHVDQAYVVFTTENREVVERSRRFLKNQNVTPLGRYGHWEYSSMSQVMRDGFAWANSIANDGGQCL